MRPLALLLLAAAAHAQPLTIFPEPSGSWERSCTQHEGVQVCRTVHEGDAHMAVSRNGRELARWEVSNSVQAGEYGAFAADLDRDGGRDLLVATQTAVSNGLGVAYWTLHVFPDGAREPAYSFQVEDFSPEGESFGHDQGRLVLWATDWIESDDPAGRRPTGMYFTGRPLALTSRGLSPLARLPVRARRLLYSFDRGAPGGPVGHLSDRRAETRRVDPALSACRQSHETVTVQGVREETGDDGSAFLVLDVGRGREVTYLMGGYQRAEEDVTHLGDRASGRLYPAEYRPSDLADTLSGRDLRLTACVHEGGWTKTRVLWL